MKKISQSILTMRKVERELRTRLLVKSVLTPAAPYASPCDVGSQAVVTLFDFDTLVVNNSSLPDVVKAVVELQWRFGLRVTECLNFTSSDIMADGSIRIRGLKGSSDRVVKPVTYAILWVTCFLPLLPLHTTFSRFYFYRIYKAQGWSGKFGNSDLNSVTHYFRHIKALELLNKFNDIELTARELGHKSLKSTEYYAKKQR